jgi:hypothetical protein
MCAYDMDKSSFVVTLPSNSNMLTHPTNRGHNYVVKLSRPTNLTNQTLNDDSRWEVALTTLEFTNRFYQLREDATIYGVVIVPDLKSTNVKATFGKTIQLNVDFIEDMSRIGSFGNTERRMLRPFVKDDTNKNELWSVVIGKFVMPAVDYKTTMELARLVANEFSAVSNIPRYQFRMVVERIGTDGSFRFTTESRLENFRRRHTPEQTPPKPGGITVDYGEASRLGKYNFMLYSKHASISPRLGQVLRAIDDQESSIYYISPISSCTPNLNTLHSLHVYSDIVEHKRGSNTSVQLMGIAPVRGSPGQRAHHVLDPPTCLPVNRSVIETTHITIHDGDDSETLLPDDVDNVVCRLHFRRAGLRIQKVELQ